MKCEVCDKGPQEGVTIYRVNPKGVKGIWRCPLHLTNDQAEKIDSTVITICTAVERRHAKGGATG